MQVKDLILVSFINIFGTKFLRQDFFLKISFKIILSLATTMHTKSKTVSPAMFIKLDKPDFQPILNPSDQKTSTQDFLPKKSYITLYYFNFNFMQKSSKFLGFIFHEN